MTTMTGPSVSSNVRIAFECADLGDDADEGVECAAHQRWRLYELIGEVLASPTERPLLSFDAMADRAENSQGGS